MEAICIPLYQTPELSEFVTAYRNNAQKEIPLEDNF